MKRKHLDEVLKVSKAKRQDRHIVIDKIVRNPKVEADIWKNTLTKKWDCEDLSYWHWSSMDHGIISDRAYHSSEAFILGNEKQVFAILFKYGLLKLFPPKGQMRETYITTSMFHPETSYRSWYDISCIVWRYLPFESWFSLGMTCKATLFYFNGPETPFIPLWTQCREFLSWIKQEICKEKPSWKCMSLFTRMFLGEFIIENQKLAVGLLKQYLEKNRYRSSAFGRYNYVELLDETKLEIVFQKKQDVQTAFCTFTKAGLVDEANKTKCFIRLEWLSRELSSFINSLC